jgi:hypothetical protein
VVGSSNVLNSNDREDEGSDEGEEDSAAIAPIY